MEVEYSWNVDCTYEIEGGPEMGKQLIPDGYNGKILINSISWPGLMGALNTISYVGPREYPDTRNLVNTIYEQAEEHLPMNALILRIRVHINDRIVEVDYREPTKYAAFDNSSLIQIWDMKLKIFKGKMYSIGSSYLGSTLAEKSFSGEIHRKLKDDPTLVKYLEEVQDWIVNKSFEGMGLMFQINRSTPWKKQDEYYRFIKREREGLTLDVKYLYNEPITYKTGKLGFEQFESAFKSLYDNKTT